VRRLPGGIRLGAELGEQGAAVAGADPGQTDELRAGQVAAGGGMRGVDPLSAAAAGDRLRVSGDLVRLATGLACRAGGGCGGLRGAAAEADRGGFEDQEQNQRRRAGDDPGRERVGACVTLPARPAREPIAMSAYP
jgi:hypothetical protein